MSPPVARAFALLLLTVLWLAGCRREDPSVAGNDPVAAVQAQVQALRDNDLLRYSQLSLPPELHARVQAHWAERIRLAAPPDDQARAEFDKLLKRLSAPDAEASLYAAFEKKVAPLESEITGQWPMMQATAGIFVKAAVEANEQLDGAEKDHINAVATALLAWLRPELLIDRNRARQAIAELTGTTRDLHLVDLQQLRALSFEQALQKAGVAMAGLKRIGAIYGLDADAMLAQHQAELLDIADQRATVKISYPLLGETIAFELAMVERDGRWYSANALRQAEAELAEAADSADIAIIGDRPVPALEQANTERADAIVD